MQSKAQSKARALTRIATPETEAELVNLARHGTTAHIETIVRACRRYGPKEEVERARRRHACRYVELHHDEEGMVVLRARLEAEAGAVLLRAIDAAAEAQYQARRAERGGSREGCAGMEGVEGSSRARHRSACRRRPADELRPSQRRADGLLLVAESALAAGLDPGTRGDRYQVVVHVDAPVLANPTEQGVSAIEGGGGVSAETCRRLACDASTVVMKHGPDGSVIDVGRRTRTIPPALRRALLQRDGGCRFPGCGLALCDAHHIRHWAEGGETSLENTTLLCRVHHRLLHEEAFQLKRLSDGSLEFRRPDGRLLPEVPLEMLEDEVDPVEAIVARLRDGAIVVDPYTGTPLWDGSTPDLSLAVGWFLDKTSDSGRERRAGGTSQPIESIDSSQSMVPSAPGQAPAAGVGGAAAGSTRAQEDGNDEDAWVVPVDEWIRQRFPDHGDDFADEGAPVDEAGDEAEDAWTARVDDGSPGFADDEETLDGDDEPLLSAGGEGGAHGCTTACASVCPGCRRRVPQPYVYVNSVGTRLSLQEAIWDPDFHREWENEDGEGDEAANFSWVIATSDN